METTNSDQNPNQNQSQSTDQAKPAAEKAKAENAKKDAEDAKKESDSKPAAEKAKADELAEAQKAHTKSVIRYTELFSKAPSDKLTIDTINILIEEREEEINEAAANSATADQPKDFTVEHNDEKYKFPIGEKKNFIVRHSRMEKLSSGQAVEDPGSVRIQIYRPEVYADLINENEKTGERNAFVQSGEKTIVLNDPTK